MANSQGPATQAHLAGSVAGSLVGFGTGTTSATINTAALANHAALDHTGRGLPAGNLRVVAFPTSGAGGVYLGAAASGTQVDIRSAVASVPYAFFVFLVN